MSSQAIYDIPQLLHLLGISDVVISPGSRSAPLTIAFSRHTAFRKYVIPDERSAAFFALGISQQTHRPTVLICTSGSAAYNYAPAVAEAYYQQVPLLIFTADRPPEWIDQWDGQTIRQVNIYGSHILKSFQLPSTDPAIDATWHIHRVVNEAALLAAGVTPGPVHLNVPLREPLYPSSPMAFTKQLKVYTEEKKAYANYSLAPASLQQYHRIAIIPGQQHFDQRISTALEQIARHLPVICDAQSNYSGLAGVVTHHDLFLASADKAQLAPDLIITFGKSIISKHLKVMLRNIPTLEHWHLNEGDFNPDPFKALTRVIRCNPALFLEQLASIPTKNQDFWHKWEQAQSKTGTYLRGCFNTRPFSEFEAVKRVLECLPDQADIHVANSMPIRYVNFMGVARSTHRIYVNRGTSGIDGTLSTAVGSAVASQRKTVLITGDLAFFYDRNGLWHQHLPDDLLIILLNNHGGGIFGMIPGPRSQPELEDYFITRQNLNAANTAKDFDMEYRCVDSREGLDEALASMVVTKGVRLLEVETKHKINQAVFDKIKTEIKEL